MENRERLAEIDTMLRRIYWQIQKLQSQERELRNERNGLEPPNPFQNLRDRLKKNSQCFELTLDNRSQPVNPEDIIC